MNILVLDNYDSFTYNLVTIIRNLGLVTNIQVIRNDKLSLKDVSVYEKILLSPGPGLPGTAGVMKELIFNYYKEKSILGICLGHQGIAEVFGAKLINICPVMHGVSSKITITDSYEPLFKKLPSCFQVGHYHSWCVDPQSVKRNLKVTAKDDHGYVMAISHQHFKVKGLQFHPESILTDFGPQIIKNWLEETT